jgi:hypothetical protein
VSVLARRAVLLSVLAACGGKIAPEEHLSGTCGKHATAIHGRAPSCTSNDSVTCSDGTYVVACACAARTCTCSKDGVSSKTVPFSDCASCAPTQDALSAVYGACGFPY